ncbi:MAG: YafY family protein [Cardiobacteriaceae bacterium]|nr:YafY family protein [Cardiobacteriaceae bacterium]
MTRTERLLDLMQTLRRRKRPVSAQTLAAELCISTRTLYRDIATLRAQGADIRGEAGIGFVLHRDSTLPPLMFTIAEIEAVILGMRFAANRAEPATAEAARAALAKIRAVLPPNLDPLAAEATYPFGDTAYSDDETAALAAIRQALREQRRLTFAYTDLKGEPSQRTVWPLAMGYFDNARLLAAWCELRQAFRHFRADRIRAPQLGSAIPMPHAYLMQRWQQATGIHPNAAKHC